MGKWEATNGKAFDDAEVVSTCGTKLFIWMKRPHVLQLGLRSLLDGGEGTA